MVGNVSGEITKPGYTFVHASSHSHNSTLISICLTLDRHYRGRRTHSLVAPMRKCKLDSSAAEFFLFSRTRTPNVNQGPFPSSPFAALLVCQADDDFFC